MKSVQILLLALAMLALVTGRHHSKAVDCNDVKNQNHCRKNAENKTGVCRKAGTTWSFKLLACEVGKKLSAGKRLF